MESFAQQKKVESLIAADPQPVSTSPDNLSVIKLLNYFAEESEGGKKISPALQELVDSETQYLISGIKLISENPTLKNQLGLSLSSAQKMASLLKARSNELLYQGILDDQAAKLAQKQFETIVTKKGAALTKPKGAPTL